MGTVGSFGLPEDLTYSAENLGISTDSLISLLEGKHPFCQKLAKANKPFVILGEGILKRKDGANLQQLVVNLSKYAKVVHEDWVGANLLPTTASSVGNTFLGLSSKLPKLNNLNNIKFFYGVGVDDPAFYLDNLETDCFSVFQTAFNNSGPGKNRHCYYKSFRRAYEAFPSKAQKLLIFKYFEQWSKFYKKYSNQKYFVKKNI